MEQMLPRTNPNATARHGTSAMQARRQAPDGGHRRNPEITAFLQYPGIVPILRAAARQPGARYIRKSSAGGRPDRSRSAVDRDRIRLPDRTRIASELSGRLDRPSGLNQVLEAAQVPHVLESHVEQRLAGQGRTTA